MNFIKHFRSLFFIAYFGLLSACAIISIPSGGEKDVVAPKLIKSQPENHSTHFKAKKFRLYFDEYVNFSMTTSQLVISPPLRKTPEVSLRGKSLVISFDDTLKANTTYTFNFGNTIADVNEGNQFKDFRFVFSTGSIIDTLSLRGNVYDAFSGLPMKDVNVMLYDTLNDSVVYHDRPLFATVSNENGFFRLDNLPERRFKIIALKDGNTNYLYDQATEQIAFADSNLTPQLALPDSLNKPNIKNDSLVKFNLSKGFTMNLFNEKDSVQRLMKLIQPYKGFGIMIFQYPLAELKLKSLFNQIAWEPLIEYNSGKDTVQFWYKSLPDDTLSVMVSDGNKLLDTVLIDQKKNFKSVKNAFEKQKFGMITNVAADWLNLNDTLCLTFSTPIEKVNFERLMVFQDSTIIQAKAFLSQKNKRSIQVVYPWKEATNYSIFAKDSLVQDMFGRSNDSLKVRFRQKPIEQYGAIILNLNPGSLEGPFIIQLIPKSGNVREQRIIEKAQQLKFELLDSGEYSFKLIVDKNKNHHWDTGRFIKKQPAEKVFVLPSTINVRANWDSEVDWNF